MKTNLKLVLLGFFCIGMLTHCTEVEVKTSEILGEWRVMEQYSKDIDHSVSGDGNGIVVLWGPWYVGGFELIEDNIMVIHEYPGIEWGFDERTSKLLIYNEENFGDDVVASFDVSIINEQLILEDEYRIYKHNKVFTEY